MTKRILMAGVLGTLAMFIWTFVAHMLLPLGEAGVRQIDNEQPLLSAMQSTIPEHGLYLFPKMSPGTDETQYGQQIANGPSGFMVYFPKRDFSFGKALGLEFLTELAQGLIAAYLLSLTRASTFGERLGFYALAGVAVAIATNASYWNWYGFPTVYVASYAFTQWVCFLCAGLVAAAMKIGAAPKVAIAVAG